MGNNAVNGNVTVNNIIKQAEAHNKNDIIPKKNGNQPKSSTIYTEIDKNLKKLDKNLIESALG